MKPTALQIYIDYCERYDIFYPKDITDVILEIEQKQLRDAFYDGWFSKSENIDINLDENYNLK